MGIVAKQGIINTIIIYSGVAIGFVNSIYLYPAILTKAEWGVVGTIVAITVILSQIAGWGGHMSLVKFLPEYRKDKSNGGLLQLVLFTALIGIGLIGLIFIVGKNWFLSYYSDEPLLQTYYNIVPFLVAGFVLFEMISGYLNATFRTSLQMFFREIVMRLLQSLLLGFYWYGLIDFNWFIIGYVLIYFLNFSLLAIYLISKHDFDLKPGKRLKEWKHRNEVITYGGYTFLSGFASSLSNRLDVLMIGALIGGIAVGGSNAGMEATASYMLAANMAMVLDMPLRAIGQIAHPVISNSWQSNDLDNIHNLYKQSSINMMITSGFLFILIWSNIDSIMEILPAKYNDIKWVFFYLGVSKLFNVSAGVNNHILATSRYFRYTFYFLITLVGLIYVSNRVFIPEYGLTGAAIATAISLVLYNIIAILFLQNKYRMNPFTIKTFVTFTALLIISAVGYYMPEFNSIWLDISVRSLTVGVLLLIALRTLNLSQDINQVLDRFLPGKK